MAIVVVTGRQWPWHREPLRMEHTDGTPVTVSAPLPLEPEPDQRPSALQPFDLQPPEQLLMPIFSPMRLDFNERREAEQRRQASRQALMIAFANALAEWVALTGSRSPVAVAVLRIHKPEVRSTYSSAVTCSHCYDAGYEDQPTEWPCDTYRAVKESM